MLAQAFAHLPMCDEAVDGDLVALICCLRYGKASLLAIGGIVFGALLLWQLVSWFLVGGIYGVLAQRPEGRGETARVLRRRAARATYLAYARLALCSLPGWFLVLFVLVLGWQSIAPRIEYALTVPQLLGPLALAIAARRCSLLHFLWTVTDYARVELTLRHESHEPSVVATYVRTLAYVLKRPLTLAHGGTRLVARSSLITIGYAYLAHGHPMYGAEGAVTLFVDPPGRVARSARRSGSACSPVRSSSARRARCRRVASRSRSSRSPEPQYTAPEVPEVGGQLRTCHLHVHR